MNCGKEAQLMVDFINEKDLGKEFSVWVTKGKIAKHMADEFNKMQPKKECRHRWRIEMQAYVGSAYETEEEAEAAKKRAISLWQSNQYVQKPMQVATFRVVQDE